MKKKQPKGIELVDSTLAAMRMQAIQVAANLRDAEPAGHSMMTGAFPGRPGKTAQGVVAEADKIMAFILK